MPTTKYPNRDALRNALDIYLDTMRPFIVQHLSQVPGETVENLIYVGLKEDRSPQSIKHTDSIESIIDFGNLPHIIRVHWDEVFASQFGSDLNMRNIAFLIQRGRNACEHRPKTDLDAEFVRTYLFLIAELLEKINKLKEKQAVEEIRNNIFVDDTLQQLTETKKQLAEAWDLIGKLTSENNDLKSKNRQLQNALDTAQSENQTLHKIAKQPKPTAKKASETKSSDEMSSLAMSLRQATASKTEPKSSGYKGDAVTALARELGTTYNKVQKALRAKYRKVSDEDASRISGLDMTKLRKAKNYEAARKFYQAKRDAATHSN